MRDHLTAEQRFLLTRLAFLYARAEIDPDGEVLQEERLTSLMDEADRMGFGDLGSQIIDWAMKQIEKDRTPR